MPDTVGPFRVPSAGWGQEPILERDNPDVDAVVNLHILVAEVELLDTTPGNLVGRKAGGKEGSLKLVICLHLFLGPAHVLALPVAGDEDVARHHQLLVHLIRLSTPLRRIQDSRQSVFDDGRRLQCLRLPGGHGEGGLR